MSYFGHIMRKQGECLEKEIMQGTVREQEQEGNQGRGGWTMWANGWNYQPKGCCEKPRTGEDGEESSTKRPTLVSRTVEERERESYTKTCCAVSYTHLTLP